MMGSFDGIFAGLLCLVAACDALRFSGRTRLSAAGGEVRSVRCTGAAWDAAEGDIFLAAAKDAARRAGAIMLEAKGDKRAVDTTKANAKDLLTVTDVACQKAIEEILLAVPGTCMLGEEDVAPGAAAAAEAARAQLASGSGVCWVVDPIDGTANFVDSLPLSAVSIALVEKSASEPRVLVGVVYDPYRDELFQAVRGRGAHLEVSAHLGATARTPLRVSQAATLADSIVYAGAPPGKASMGPSLRGIGAVAPLARTMRLLGSAALMLAYVAAGRGAAYFEADLAAWDTAAGALLIEEAGGKLTDAAGVDYHALTRQIVATNGHIHQELFDVLHSVRGVTLDQIDEN